MKKNNKYIIATFLCLIIYLIYLKMMQIFPFGEYSILKCDLYQQYINFFCYLKEVILHGKSIIISWNLGLANNFYTTFAYYLISPLNILVVFFDSSNMDIFVEIITFIKIALMANFMILFLEKSYDYKNNEAVLFGLIYAYSSYVICYSFHIMWLDCLYMLPIILLYVDKYLKTGRIIPIIVTLSYAILTNYYIGYIVAFFTGIYYLARYFSMKKLIKTNSIVLLFKSLGKFLFAILVSFGIGMIVILPSLLQLKGKMSADITLFQVDSEKIKLFSNVIFNNYVYMFTQKSCFVFSSTFITLLIPMYYLNKNISCKEKIAFTAIIVFLLLPIFSPFLNKLWHAFTVPNCFNYRYSFTLIFTLILMATREFQNREYSRKWHFLASAAVFFIFTLLEIIFLEKGYLVSDGYFVTEKSIILSSLIYIAMFFTLLIENISKNKSIKLNSWKNQSILTKMSKKKYIYTFLCLLIITDLIIGAKSGQNNNDKYFKRESFTQYNGIMKHLKQKIKTPETERIVFEPDVYGSNMSLRYGYSNIGFFTSARNRKTLKAMYRLGYNVQMDEQLWITSFSGTFLNYSMAGVKYYITKNEKQIYGFELEERYEDYFIYKNKNAFNIGYYLSKNIKQSYNPFKMQNEILDAMNKNNNYEKEKYFQNIENSELLDCKKEIKGDKIKYILQAKKNCNIYLASEYDLQIYINERPLFKNYSNIWSTETGIKQIKSLKENEKIEFTIETKQNLEQLYLYASNNSEIQKSLDSMKTNTFENIKINTNGLIGTANFKDDGYLTFGIAYDDCWKIFVDGKEYKKEAIAGAFLGVKLNKGIHKIEIKAKMNTIFMK